MSAQLLNIATRTFYTLDILEWNEEKREGIKVLSGMERQRMLKLAGYSGYVILKANFCDVLVEQVRTGKVS